MRKRCEARAGGRRLRRKLAVEQLEHRALLAGAVVINEILASNNDLYRDYDDDDTDWIELLNTSGSNVDIGGWFLTDDQANLTKWQVPASTVLAPYDPFLIFASGKDFVAPTGEMHTNFRLNDAGEYLAIVEPDGLTISSEIAPEYPPQFRNVSYGSAQLIDTTVLVSEGSTGKVLVPTDATVDATWTAPAFDDASWTAATTAIGYATQGPENIVPGYTVRMLDVNGGTNPQLNNTTEALALVDSVIAGTHNPAEYQLGTNIVTTGEVADFGGGEGTFPNTQTYPDGTASTALEDFLVEISGTVTIPAGNWTIALGSDDGGLVKLQDVTFSSKSNSSASAANEIRYENPRGHAWTSGQFTVPAGGITTSLRALFYERGGGDSFEVAIRAGHFNNSVNSVDWTILEDGALGWDVETNAVPPIPPYESLIATDLEADMYDQHTSAYLRTRFTVDDASVLDTMTLRMKYDDAFIAYINGTEVARSNFSGTPAFNSTAAAARNDSLALTYQEFNLSSDLNLLQTGANNVLAIHAINVQDDATGLLALAELEVVEVLSTNRSYMANPTPDAANATGSIGALYPPTFSVDGGTFTSDFNLTLTSPDPSAAIRYTNDLSEPTENSILYTGPISITVTTQIRACAFRTDYVPSEIVTESYLRLGADLQNYLGSGQAFQSDIPFIVLDTFGQGIDASDFKNIAFGLYEPTSAGPASFADEPTLQSRAGLKVRGSSSSGFSKRPYALELREDYSDDDDAKALLGMEAESDWVLHGPYVFDRTFTHNAFIFELSQQLGVDAMDTRFIEVFNNQDGGELTYGDYFGVYVLIEKIKRDAGRVDVQKLSPQYSTEPEISGGYVLKIDRADPGDTGFNAGGQTWRYVDPKEIEIEQNPLQQAYITQYINEFWAALSSSTFTHPTTGQPYSAWVDVAAAIDHHLLNELMLNVDALRLSGYWYKDRDGLLTPGPIWDFDRAAESADGRDDNPATWYMDIEGVPNLWKRFFVDLEFRQAYIDRWVELRQGKFSDANLFASLDNLIEGLGPDVTTNNPVEPASMTRDTARWNQDPRNGSNYPSGELNGTWKGEIAHMKAWLAARTAWLDSLFVAPPTISQGGVIMPPHTVTLSGPAGVSIYYTTDGSDPRESGGGISPQAQLYTGPFSVTTTTLVKARSYDPTHNVDTPSANPSAWDQSGAGIVDQEMWSGLSTSAFTLESPPSIRITEVNYHPRNPDADELAIDPSLDDNDFEFVEIKNIGSNPVNLVGTQFTNGISFTFPNMILNPGAFTLVVKDPGGFEARYGTGLNVAGVYSGSLSNGGERIVLLDALGAVIHDFQYDVSGAWPGRADGKGSSLEVRDVAGDYDNDNNWRPSQEYHGSPGFDGVTYTDIVINEVLTHTDPPLVDFVELYNTTSTPIDISGWYLSDSSGDYRKFEIPNDDPLAGGGYVTFDEDDFNLSMGVDPNDFSFSSAHGDDVYLLQTDANGEFTRFVDHVEFGAARNAESFGRWPNGVGELYPLVAITESAHNAPPRVGPVVISEIMYNPPNPDGPGGIDPDDLEFVEIYNGGTQTESLNRWKLLDAVGFEFADGTLLAPMEAIVVISFNPDDPLNASRLADFRNHYGIDNSVRLFGGYSGKLNNGGEDLILSRPDMPPDTEPNFYPELLEDEADYDDDPPWPTAPDGTGKALVRLAPDTFGNDPASWQPDDPTPGTVPFHPTGPTVVDRRVLYGNSSFADDAAIATNKFALRPGASATFANYSSYHLGINAIVVDAANFPQDPTLGDFEFRTGNSNDLAGWSLISASSVAVSDGAGLLGSKRIRVFFADHQIENEWVQVTVRATANTGLTAPDVFYFGSVVGDTGDSSSHTLVNAFDLNGVRSHAGTADINSPYDFDRNQLVDGADFAAARDGHTNFTTAVKLITPVLLPPPPAAIVWSPSSATSCRTIEARSIMREFPERRAVCAAGGPLITAESRSLRSHPTAREDANTDDFDELLLTLAESRLDRER